MPIYSSEDAFNRALSKVLTDDASVLAADGTTPSTISVYRINLSLGDLLVGGEYLNQAALTDQVLIGSGAWAKSLDLNGDPAVVLTADGQTYDCVLVAINKDGAPALYAVFGDEAADGSEETPTDLQAQNALKLALGDAYDDKFGLVTNIIKWQRAGGAMTVTATDPAANDALKAKRLAGTLNN